MSDRTILNTGFTVDFVINKLRESGKLFTEGLEVSNLKSFKAKKNETPAFMSQIIELTFEWIDKAPINSVILKVPGFQNPAKQENTDDVVYFLKVAHTRECEFYAYVTAEKSDVKVPQYFYGHPYDHKHNDGLIVMEDLSGTAKTTRMIPGFTNGQMETLINELAIIHSTSWLKTDWIELFGKSIPGADMFVINCRDVAQELRSIDPKFNDLLDRMDPLYVSETFQKTSYIETRNGVPPCFVHSDLWAANVLWEVDQNGNPSSNLAAIIDWQTVHGGNPGEDLVRLFGMNSSAEYRRENTIRLLTLYYNKVIETVGYMIFTFEELLAAYNDCMAIGAVVATFGAPLYLKMDNVTGGPNGDELKKELLHRVASLMEDTLAVNKL